MFLVLKSAFKWKFQFEVPGKNIFGTFWSFPDAKRITWKASLLVILGSGSYFPKRCPKSFILTDIYRLEQSAVPEGPGSSPQSWKAAFLATRCLRNRLDLDSHQSASAPSSEAQQMNTRCRDTWRLLGTCGPIILGTFYFFKCQKDTCPLKAARCALFCQLAVSPRTI